MFLAGRHSIEQPYWTPYLDGPLDLIQPAVGRVVSIGEVQLQCKIDSDLDDDDSLLNRMIDEVTDWFQKTTGGRQLLTASYQMPVACWWTSGWSFRCPEGYSHGRVYGDGVLRLPKPPLRSVIAVKYYDAADALQTLATTNYIVRTPLKQPGEIALRPSATLPALSNDRPHPIEIQFVAGSLTPVVASQVASTLTAVVATYTAGDVVVFSASSDGGIPSPLIANVNYYVVNVTNGGLTFQVSATPGGSAITLTSTGSDLLWTGAISPNARAAILLKIAERYNDRDNQIAKDSGGWTAADRLARMEEWGAYK